LIALSNRHPTSEIDPTAGIRNSVFLSFRDTHLRRRIVLLLIFPTIREEVMRALWLGFLLLVAGPALAGEKLVSTEVDLRTVLNFKATDAAVQKMLPEGWELNSPAAGPTKGFNIAVVLVDRLLAADAEGKPVVSYRGAALAIPAKKKTSDTAGAMIVGGLFEPSGAPGAYGVFTAAQTTIERKTVTDPGGKSMIEETWQFKASDGSSIEVEVHFVRGIPVKGKAESKVFSATRPDFHRIYRFEQATDVVRSTATAVDRVTKFSFEASGAKLAPLFDGSQQLISVISVPWYSRHTYLPGW
jgi:hypothetical protein